MVSGTRLAVIPAYDGVTDTPLFPLVNRFVLLLLLLNCLNFWCVLPYEDVAAQNPVLGILGWVQVAT